MCPNCGQESEGQFPEGVTNPVQYGSGIKSLAVYFKCEQLIPYRRSQQILSDLFELTISQGSLETFITTAADQVEPVIEKIKGELKTAEVVHYDESGFYIGECKISGGNEEVG